MQLFGRNSNQSRFTALILMLLFMDQIWTLGRWSTRGRDGTPLTAASVAVGVRNLSLGNLSFLGMEKFFVQRVVVVVMTLDSLILILR